MKPFLIKFALFLFFKFKKVNQIKHPIIIGKDNNQKYPKIFGVYTAILYLTGKINITKENIILKLKTKLIFFIFISFFLITP